MWMFSFTWEDLKNIAEANRLCLYSVWKSTNADIVLDRSKRKSFKELQNNTERSPVKIAQSKTEQS